jgi:ankyrin repeat protein
MSGSNSTFRRIAAAAGIIILVGVVVYVRLHPPIRTTVRINFVKSDTSLYDAIAGGESIEKVKEIIAKNPGLVKNYRFYGQSALILAATRQRSDLVSLFVDMGADVDSVFEDESGAKDDTALHIAASHDDVKTIEVLLKHGADARRRDRYGRTPLDIAVGFNYEAAADALRMKEH